MVSPAPWRSSRAPSSSGNQPPSEEDSLPPWSWEREREGTEERGTEEEYERKSSQKPADISDVSSQMLSPIHLHCIQTAGSPVGSVSRAEGIVDVNVSEFGQRCPEGVDLLLSGLSLRDRKAQERV